MKKVFISLALLLFCSMIGMIIYQQIELNKLKATVKSQGSSISYIYYDINDLQTSSEDAENNISDLDDRINDLENRRYVLTTTVIQK